MLWLFLFDKYDFNMEDNKIEIRINYKKKIVNKFKKIKLYLFNKTYHKPVSFLTAWEFLKIFIFIAILVLLFIKFLLPAAS